MRAGQGYYRGLAFEEAEIASFDGLRLHARVCGAEAGKPLLLLLHGWRSSAAPRGWPTSSVTAAIMKNTTPIVNST